MNFRILWIPVLLIPCFLFAQDRTARLKPVISYHDSLVKLFEKNRQFDSALFHYDLFITNRDSLTASVNREAQITEEIRFGYQKKLAEDSVRAANQQRVASAKLIQSEATLRNHRIIRTALFCGLALIIVFSVYMINRFRLVNRQKKMIELQKKSVEQQKLLTEIKQAEILDSINYARRIQNALLPNEKYIDRILKKLK